MSCKSVMKWPKQITSALVEQLLRSEKDLQKAITIFDSATAEYSNGFKHDNTTFSHMISRLLSANQFRPAEELLSRMKNEKCTVDEQVFLSIFRAYGRVHKPMEVIRVFELMKEYNCEPTQKTYITVFSILVTENRLKTAMKFYRYMKLMNIPPTVASLNILIKALCKNSKTVEAALNIFLEMPKHGFIPDSYTFGTLINGFCQLGKIDEAKELFAEMKESGCSPTVVTYTCLIRGLCHSHNVDEAMLLLVEMKSQGIEPNGFTYSSLMDGLCKCGHSSDALKLLEMMATQKILPNMIIYSTLVHGLCSEGKLSEALEIFDRMKLQGLKPDVGLYGKIINVFCDAGKFLDAANFLDEMILAGIIPNKVTMGLHIKIHNTVVLGLCKGYLDRAFQMYQTMRSRKIPVDVKTFGSLVDFFCSRKEEQKAAQILDEMLRDGCDPEVGTWTAVLARVCDRKKVLDAADLLVAEVFRSSQTRSSDSQEYTASMMNVVINS